jgi:hypothetical protein
MLSKHLAYAIKTKKNEWPKMSPNNQRGRSPGKKKQKLSDEKSKSTDE